MTITSRLVLCALALGSTPAFAQQKIPGAPCGYGSAVWTPVPGHPGALMCAEGFDLQSAPVGVPYGSDPAPMPREDQSDYYPPSADPTVNYLQEQTRQTQEMLERQNGRTTYDLYKAEVDAAQGNPQEQADIMNDHLRRASPQTAAQIIQDYANRTGQPVTVNPPGGGTPITVQPNIPRAVWNPGANLNGTTRTQPGRMTVQRPPTVTAPPPTQSYEPPRSNYTGFGPPKNCVLDWRGVTVCK